MAWRTLLCFTLTSFALYSVTAFGEVPNASSGVSDAGLQSRYVFDSIDDGRIRDKSTEPKNAKGSVGVTAISQLNVV